MRSSILSEIGGDRADIVAAQDVEPRLRAWCRLGSDQIVVAFPPLGELDQGIVGWLACALSVRKLQSDFIQLWTRRAVAPGFTRSARRRRTWVGFCLVFVAVRLGFAGLVLRSTVRIIHNFVTFADRGCLRWMCRHRPPRSVDIDKVQGRGPVTLASDHHYLAATRSPDTTGEFHTKSERVVARHVPAERRKCALQFALRRQAEIDDVLQHGADVCRGPQCVPDRKVREPEIWNLARSARHEPAGIASCSVIIVVDNDRRRQAAKVPGRAQTALRPDANRNVRHQNGSCLGSTQ